MNGTVTTKREIKTIPAMSMDQVGLALVDFRMNHMLQPRLLELSEQRADCIDSAGSDNATIDLTTLGFNNR